VGHLHMQQQFLTPAGELDFPLGSCMAAAVPLKYLLVQLQDLLPHPTTACTSQSVVPEVNVPAQLLPGKTCACHGQRTVRSEQQDLGLGKTDKKCHFLQAVSNGNRAHLYHGSLRTDPR
jgi:hypothetical protein